MMQKNTTPSTNGINIHKTLYPTEYTFFSRVHRIYIKKDHTVGHNTNLNKFKRTEIIHSYVHNGINLEIDNRKYSNPWKLNNTLLNNSWVKQEI